MKRFSRRIVPLLLAVFLVPVVSADTTDNNTVKWLDRMYMAMHTLNYEGTIVYIYDNQLETVQVIHRADMKGGVERLVSLTGPQREVIRDHKEVKYILPEDHSVLIERRYAAAHFLAPIPQQIDFNKLAGYYLLSEFGQERIADHTCKVISIQARDDYRYGYKLWLDANTGMLLRSDLITQDGHTVERVIFTSIQYPREIPDVALKATEIKPGYTWNIQGGSEKIAGDKAHLVLKVGQLPPGFIITMDDVQHMAGTQLPVRHLVVSDGLASVSVFAGTGLSGRKQQLIGPSHVEAISAFGRQIGDHNVTVVGEVPPKTVELIAQSIKLEPQR